MKGTKFQVVKRSEAFAKTGKAPLSFKWVDTGKTHGVGKTNVRARWVARDPKTPAEKDRRFVLCHAAAGAAAVFVVAAGHKTNRWGRAENHVHRRSEGPLGPRVQGGRVRRAPDLGGGRG